VLSKTIANSHSGTEDFSMHKVFHKIFLHGMILQKYVSTQTLFFL